MTTLIQLSKKKLAALTLETTLLELKDSSIKIPELIIKEVIYLVHLLHDNLNNLLDFSNAKNCLLLYFEENKDFIGAGYAINNSQGSFFIQTQSKWVLLIPYKQSLHKETIQRIENFKLIH